MSVISYQLNTRAKIFRYFFRNAETKLGYSGSEKCWKIYGQILISSQQ
ncbi:Uncharacterized protein dnm_017630 [Desulfonema magnum]|uniref:Uncharacterized protein n=1 Tax=Desulfonema magnum TaxID=45655 RepID=A0A975BIJ6_9BACT|nr:Uncharacterized protein dnm_017630 [Desulfonema magnum]